MRLREWVNQNSAVSTIAAAVLLVVALATLVALWDGPGGEAARAVYYWDLEGDRHFVTQSGNMPPIEAPSGGDGVRAHLYSCGACAPDEWFGYLETFTAEARAHYEQEGVPPEDDAAHRVRALHVEAPGGLDGEAWVPYTSVEGERIREAVYLERRCEDGSVPEQCRP